jgi:hypothetical protein
VLEIVIMVFSRENTCMTKNRIFITATTVVVVFFLTSLGMRLPFLEKSLKPKPRPRAVLNLFAKSASSAACATKQDFAPSLDILHESVEYHIPVSILTGINVTYFIAPADFHRTLPLQGRSPPHG